MKTSAYPFRSRTGTVLHVLKLRIFLLLATSAICGCGVKLRDHTPPVFPWYDSRDYPTSAASALFPSTTPFELIEFGKTPKHRFFLEVKSQNVRDIRAFITVNGEQHPMKGSGDGVWTYEQPDECNGRYDYHFKVNYRSGSAAYKSKALGSASDPFTTTVNAFGDATWFAANYEPSNTVVGEVTFLELDALRNIVVQNLSKSTLELDLIAFPARPSPEYPDIGHFRIVGRPSLPIQLGCGESTNVLVEWFNDFQDSTGLLVIKGEFTEGAKEGEEWGASIFLKGKNSG